MCRRAEELCVGSESPATELTDSDFREGLCPSLGAQARVVRNRNAFVGLERKLLLSYGVLILGTQEDDVPRERCRAFGMCG